jgi:hypothetical protein
VLTTDQFKTFVDNCWAEAEQVTASNPFISYGIKAAQSGFDKYVLPVLMTKLVNAGFLTPS